MSRKINFYAGPSTLPVDVLAELKKNIDEYQGMGLSLIETSHRSKEYDAVHNEAISLFRELLNIPEDYHVLFLGGGATLQFSMIPMNFLPAGRSCDFTLTGTWASKAYADTKKVGKVEVLFDGKDSGYTTLPESLEVHKDAAYLHITSNETIGGLQWQKWPEAGNVPIIADMSSDILSRPLPVEKFAMIYAGAQKNLGPAGVTIAIIRKDLLERCPDSLTAYLNYRTHADKNSLYNTPPVFSIYAMMHVLRWVKKQGGAEAMDRLSREKAAIIYNIIDESNGFYTCPVEEKSRSRMNIVFRLKNEDMEKTFIAEAGKRDMLGLKGHRVVGGCRASIYNSMPKEGVQQLADFMKEFARDRT
ncbi:MAG: 3-phosphoserine/phosphohydroxythreonine transaminase [Spirochaetales bacterium]|nr:3-phosphoserine/phosphohydroxythreonine transaminase [Spirochaetales bacterium]